MKRYISSAKDLSRRDFVKKTGQGALALGGGMILNSILKGCATITFKEQSPVIYPPLKGQKVQPPEYRSYFGFHTQKRNVGDRYEWIWRRIGTRPKIWIPPYRMMSHPQRKKQWWEYGWKYPIPFVFLNIHEKVTGIKFENLLKDKTFARFVKRNAEDVVEFRKPVFVSMMPELNGPWWPWSKKPKETKEVWRYVWRIFEDTGANEYATWVLHLALFDQTNCDPPGAYYPGDEYIDWIGLVSYSLDGTHSSRMSLKELTNKSYSRLRKDYSDKPLMLAEFGKSTGRKQNRWIKEAYEYIRLTPGIKASICWEMRHPQGWKTYLTDESFETLEEILQDDYFIRA